MQNFSRTFDLRSCTSFLLITFLLSHWQNYNNNENSSKIDNIWLWHIHLCEVVWLNWRENPSVRTICPCCDFAKEEINFQCKSFESQQWQTRRKRMKNMRTHAIEISMGTVSVCGFDVVQPFDSLNEKHILSSGIESDACSLSTGGDGGSGWKRNQEYGVN